MPPSNDLSSESDIEHLKQKEKSADIAFSGTESDLEHIKEAQNKRKRRYACTFENCSETFRRKDNLDRHVFKHTGEKIHACYFEGCDKVYSIETHLRRHVLSFHEKQRKDKVVQCQVSGCSKKFSAVHVMERHMRQVHENKCEFECKECGSQFKRKFHLTRHQIVAHTKEYPYQCEKCQKKFVQECNLKRHVCKAYKCDLCEIFFDKWSELVEHKKSFNHSSTFKCDNCSKQFDRQSLLNMHAEQHQGDEREVFPCTVDGCPKFYYHNRNLTAHIRVHHNGSKFQCQHEGCDGQFATKQKMHQHMQSVHVGKSKVVKPKSKKRAKRKDAGVSKTTALAMLSGVICPPTLDKQLRNGDVEVVVADDAKEAAPVEMDVSGEESEPVQKVIELVFSAIDDDLK